MRQKLITRLMIYRWSIQCSAAFSRKYTPVQNAEGLNCGSPELEQEQWIPVKTKPEPSRPKRNGWNNRDNARLIGNAGDLILANAPGELCVKTTANMAPPGITSRTTMLDRAPIVGMKTDLPEFAIVTS